VKRLALAGWGFAVVSMAFAGLSLAEYERTVERERPCAEFGHLPLSDVPARCVPVFLTCREGKTVRDNPILPNYW